MDSQNRPTHKRRQRERGQALVEFALVAPIFLILVLGIVDFGWALRSWITVTNSAREGARLGAVGADCDAIKQRVVNTSADLLATADVSVDNCQGDPGTDVGVTVSYGYDFITPLGNFLGGFTKGDCDDPPDGVDDADLCIGSTSDMRLE